MPFVNNAQMRACYAKRSRALSLGQIPTWDCKEFGKGHVVVPKIHKSPAHKSPARKSKVLKSKVRKSKVRKSPVHQGPRGGKYVMYKGDKVYLPRQEKMYIGVRGGKYIIRNEKKVYV